MNVSPGSILFAQLSCLAGLAERVKAQSHGILAYTRFFNHWLGINAGRLLIILLLLCTTCPVVANSVDPDQLASEEAN